MTDLLGSLGIPSDLVPGDTPVSIPADLVQAIAGGAPGGLEGGGANSPAPMPIPGATGHPDAIPGEPGGRADDTKQRPGPKNTSTGKKSGALDVLQQAAYGPHNQVHTGDEQSERAIAALVRELFYRAREARRPLMAQWKRNYIELNNREYKPGGNGWDERPSVSEIWPVVASATAWMTDQRPKLEVTPTSEPFSPYWEFYQKLAVDLNQCLDAGFTNYSLDGEITKSIWDVYTYGIAYFKTQWEAHLADGLGDTVFRRVDPFNVYPDPHARTPSDLTYIIEARTMTVADADRAWPGAAAKIGSSTSLEDIARSPHKLDSTVNPNQPRAALKALAPASGTQSHGTVDNPSKTSDAPVVTVLEAYVRGHLVTPTDTDGVSRVTDEWRCIVICGDILLMDEPCSEMAAYDTHPYDRLVLSDTGEWYGPCIVELLSPVQRTINWLLEAINRNVYLMGNPVLVESLRSASRNKRLTNRPGQRFEADPGGMQWLNPPQIHPQLSVQLIEYYKSEIETISGLSAMVRGFSPTGRNSQGVLDSVQDAAFVRVRSFLRELERALRGVSSKMAATVSEFYTEPRLMSIIGPDGQKTALSLKARHFYVVDPEDAGNRIPMRFSIAPDAGSQLPTSKQARSAEAKHLFSIGAIDVYELLKAVEWPHYATVAKRITEMQAAAAAQEPQKN